MNDRASRLTPQRESTSPCPRSLSLSGHGRTRTADAQSFNLPLLPTELHDQMTVPLMGVYRQLTPWLLPDDRRSNGEAANFSVLTSLDFDWITVFGTFTNSCYDYRIRLNAEIGLDSADLDRLNLLKACS